VPSSRFSFRHYGDEHGLENPIITSLVQDRRGFLWVGTQDGLYRFDGRGFVRFGRQEGLPSSFVEALHVDTSGVLWVGTAAGLALVEGEAFRIFGPKDGIPGGIPPQGIGSDPAGRLYVATSEGLRELRDGRFVDPLATGAWPGKITAVLPGADGLVFIGGVGRVGRFDGRTVEVWGNDAGVPPERIDALLVDGGGTLWVRSANHLVVRTPAGRFLERGQGLPPSNYFGSLYVDRSGELWVPTDLGLARRAGENGWDVIGQKRGLTADPVNAVVQDREGLLWVGLAGGRLHAWLGYPSWTAVTTSEGLSNDSIWSIARDTSGSLWVGTDQGLNRLDDRTGRWQAWQKADGLAGECAYVVRPGGTGVLWVGFVPGGLSRFDTERNRAENYGATDGLMGDRVYALAPAKDGTLWAGTSAGLYRAPARPGRLRFARVSAASGEAERSVRALLFDRSGRLWVGGENGLAVLEAGKWTRLSTRDGLRDDFVYALAEGGQGEIWVAYWEALGVSRLDKAENGWRLRHLDRRAGLASDAVEFLAGDHGGRIWIGTTRGLNLLDGDRLDHYGRSDGLVWDSTSALAEGGDGGYWIGTSRGLARFLPRARPLPPPPTVVLLRARLGDKSFALDAPADVPYAQRTLEVAFAGLAFQKPEETRFRYRLVGLEENATETSLREVRYPRLPYGNYIFEVDCKSALGVWSQSPARFSFRIRPPWYLNRFAIAGSLTLFVAGAWLAYRRRVHSLVEARAELEDAVAERTRELIQEKRTVEEQARALLTAAEERRNVYATVVHDLKNPLTPIMGGVEILEADMPRESERGQRALGLIRHASHRLLFLVESLATALRASVQEGRHDWQGFGAYDLLSDLAQSYATAARARGLTLTLEGARVDETWVPPRGGALVRAPAGPVYRVMENIVGNALKYAAGEIRLAATEDDTHVGLSVENDGPAIPDADKERIFRMFEQLPDAKRGTGIGLASAKRQMEEMGGWIAVKDPPSGGARFEIWLPRRPAARPEAAAAG
jgi:signal transduction histidine kinase/ligand-binding sensor domain-containing protein